MVATTTKRAFLNILWFQLPQNVMMNSDTMIKKALQFGQTPNMLLRNLPVAEFRFGPLVRFLWLQSLNTWSLNSTLGSSSVGQKRSNKSSLKVCLKVLPKLRTQEYSRGAVYRQTLRCSSHGPSTSPNNRAALQAAATAQLNASRLQKPTCSLCLN